MCSYSSLTSAIIQCNTQPDKHLTRTGHMPIVMLLDIGIDIQMDAPHPNYRAADWEEVRKELALKRTTVESGEDIQSEAEFY